MPIQKKQGPNVIYREYYVQRFALKNICVFIFLRSTFHVIVWKWLKRITKILQKGKKIIRSNRCYNIEMPFIPDTDEIDFLILCIRVFFQKNLRNSKE